MCSRNSQPCRKPFCFLARHPAMSAVFGNVVARCCSPARLIASLSESSMRSGISCHERRPAPVISPSSLRALAHPPGHHFVGSPAGETERVIRGARDSTPEIGFSHRQETDAAHLTDCAPVKITDLAKLEGRR